MKKLLLTAAAAIALSSTANAVLLDNHFKKYGYTKPSFTLMDTQNLINKGISVSREGLFKDKLNSNAAVPQILNANRLLNALKSKKKLIVADNKPCLPVFEELARQNGIKCDELIGHLETNQVDGEDLFTNISTTLKSVEDKVNEIISKETESEINDIVNELTPEELGYDPNELVPGLTNDKTYEEAINEGLIEVTTQVEADIQEEVSRTLSEILDEVYDNLTPTTQEIFDIITEEGPAVAARDFTDSQLEAAYNELTSVSGESVSLGSAQTR